MADRIDTPPTLVGDEKAQLQQLWSYLYQMSQAMNNNLEAIGGNELTDSERQVMQKILTGDELSSGMNEMETLKSLIIKTADFVQTSLTEYRLNLLGSTVASGQFGRYVRNTGLDVEVNPEGITQNYSFQEIVQGLKHYEINAKNYIKTGLLRTVSSIPVYGVAIGKDVVTFDENGTETYVDGNKVAELTADELSFWQNGVKVAGYTGSRISFYYNGTECFYILNGKLYCNNDLTLASGKMLIINSSNLKMDENGNVNFYGSGNFTLYKNNIMIDSFSGSFAIINKSLVTNHDFYFYIGSVFHPAALPEPENYGQLEPVKITETIDGTQYVAFPTEIKLIDRLTVASRVITTRMIFGVHNIKIEGNIESIPVLRMIGTSNNEAGTDLQYLNCAVKFYYGLFTKIDTTYLEATYGTIDILTYTSMVQQSSRDIKHDIRPLDSMGEKLDALQPVTFVYDEDENEQQRMGLIYEDTIEVMPEICTGDESNKAINYVELIPALLKEIQELRARVAELERRMDNVQGD